MESDFFFIYFNHSVCFRKERGYFLWILNLDLRQILSSLIRVTESRSRTSTGIATKSSLAWVGPLPRRETTHRKIRNTQKHSKIHNSASRVQRVHFSSTGIAHLPLFLLSVVTSVFICQAPRTGLNIFKWRTSKGSYMHYFLLHSTHSPVLLGDHLLRLNGNPLQYSCLENSMDRGVRGATIDGVTRSQTQLSD